MNIMTSYIMKLRLVTSVLLPGPDGNGSLGRILNILPATLGYISSNMSRTKVLNLHMSWLINTRKPTNSLGCQGNKIYNQNRVIKEISKWTSNITSAYVCVCVHMCMVYISWMHTHTHIFYGTCSLWFHTQPRNRRNTTLCKFLKISFKLFTYSLKNIQHRLVGEKCFFEILEGGIVDSIFIK